MNILLIILLSIIALALIHLAIWVACGLLTLLFGLVLTIGATLIGLVAVLIEKIIDIIYNIYMKIRGRK